MSRFMFDFAGALVTELLDGYERDFAADADAIGALCTLLYGSLRAGADGAAERWCSWEECVAVFERCFAAAEAKDARNAASHFGAPAGALVQMRTALLSFLLARVHEAAIDSDTARTVLGHVAGDGQSLQFTFEGYVALSDALLDLGDEARARSVLRSVVTHEATRRADSATRSRFVRTLAALEVGDGNDSDTAAYGRALDVLRLAQPLPLDVAALEFVALLDGVTGAEEAAVGDDASSAEGETSAASERALGTACLCLRFLAVVLFVPEKKSHSDRALISILRGSFARVSSEPARRTSKISSDVRQRDSGATWVCSAGAVAGAHRRALSSCERRAALDCAAWRHSARAALGRRRARSAQVHGAHFSRSAARCSVLAGSD